MPTDLKRPICKNPDCRRQFTKQQGTNRLYCYECRPERTVVPIRADRDPQDPESGEIGENDGPLTRKSLKQLQEWAVEDTWQAESCLTLARAIDAGKGGGSAGLAGAIKAHFEAMNRAQAISTVNAEDDKIEWIFRDQA